MKIKFENGSYLDVSIGKPGKVKISIGAIDVNNLLKINVTVAEITLEEFGSIVKELRPFIPSMG